MELKKDTNPTKSVNVVSSQSPKTSFGKLYAAMLIVLLAAMAVGQFFCPFMNAKSSDDEKTLIAATQQAKSRETEDYDYDDFLAASIARQVDTADEETLERGFLYTIGAKHYPLSLENNKYPVSLMNLSDSKYNLDISCNKNHSKLIINGVFGISCICLIACLVFAAIGIIQLKNNTNKSCISLSLAFIPMALAKLALMLTALPIKNFRCFAVNHENIAVIVDSPHISILTILMLIVSACIPVISLKVIHRT